MNYALMFLRGGGGGGGGYTPPPDLTITNGRLYVKMPAGLVADIYIQRNGVDIGPSTQDGASIPAAFALGVGVYEYKLTDADYAAPETLSPRIVNVAYETNAPRRYALKVTEAEPNVIQDIYDETLDPASLPSTADATLAGTVATAKTVTGVAIVGNIVRWTVSSRYVPGDAPTFAYTPGTNRLRDLAHTPNNVPAQPAIAVWNDMPPPATPVLVKTGAPYYVAPGSGGAVRDSNPSGNGWGFQPTLAEFALYDSARSSGDPAHGNNNVTLVESGWVQIAVDSNAAMRACCIGGQPFITLAGYTVRVASGVAQAYLGNTTVGSAYTFPSVGSGVTYARVKRVFPSGLVTMDTSADGAVTWTTRATFPDPYTDQRVVACFFTDSQTVPVIGAVQGYEDEKGF